MADGYLHTCKGCTSVYDKQRREKYPEKLKEYEQRRSKTLERKAKLKVYARTTQLRHPTERAAHIQLGNAVRDGKITKLPCLICGESKVEGHHPDYSEPLLVVWLCQPHHKQLHKEFSQ